MYKYLESFWVNLKPYMKLNKAFECCKFTVGGMRGSRKTKFDFILKSLMRA